MVNTGLQEDSRDRDTECPPLDSGCSSGSTSSVEPRQSRNGNTRINNRRNGRQTRNSLPVDKSSRLQRQFVRYEVPPRFLRKLQSQGSIARNVTHEMNGNGPAAQLLPQGPPPTVPCNQDSTLQPPPPPAAPYSQGALHVCLPPPPHPGIQAPPPAERAPFEGTGTPSILPIHSSPPRPRAPILDLSDPLDNRRFFIRLQVEHYFKPFALCKDLFLQRNMDADGYVPISLIATFPKVREMTKDLNLLMEAIRSSEELQVCGDKVRPKNRPGHLHQVDVTTAPPQATDHPHAGHHGGSPTSGPVQTFVNTVPSASFAYHHPTVSNPWANQLYVVPQCLYNVICDTSVPPPGYFGHLGGASYPPPSLQPYLVGTSHGGDQL